MEISENSDKQQMSEKCNLLQSQNIPNKTTMLEKHNQLQSQNILDKTIAYVLYGAGCT
jgi:hypothetical protein